MHALHPRVQVVLRLGDVAPVGRRHAGIVHAERHGALRERAVHGVLGGGAELDPVVPEAGLDAGGDHRFQHVALRLVAHPVQQFAAGAHVLNRRQVAALVMHAGEAVACELLRDVRDAVASALLVLGGREGGPRADRAERIHGAVGDPAVELAVGILVVGAAHRVRRALGDARHVEGFAVVERRVAAAVAHHHGMVLRHLVQVLHVQAARIFHLGVVEEVAVHPRAGWHLLGARLQLADDAEDAHELHFEGIADQHVVEQRFAAGVVVAVDEAGHDGESLGIEGLRAWAGQVPDVAGAAHGSEAAAGDGERLGAGGARVHGVDRGIDHDQVRSLSPAGGRLREGLRGGRGADERGAHEAGHAGAGDVHEVAAAAAIVRHVHTLRASPPGFKPCANVTGPVPVTSQTAAVSATCQGVD